MSAISRRSFLLRWLAFALAGWLAYLLLRSLWTIIMLSPSFQVETTRLRLIPCTVEAAQAASAGTAALETLLGMRVPADWPAADLRDFLPLYAQLVGENAARQGWGIWLVLCPLEQTLIGDIGFKGQPDDAGTVEIGYSVLPAFQGCGYASEAARALVGWAFAQPAVRRVVAECLDDNLPSIRVLEKLGMRRLEPDGKMLRWELTRADGHEFIGE